MIGWEWHNRNRKADGRWGEKYSVELAGDVTVQLHIRTTNAQAAAIRAAALANREELGEYVIAACRQRIERDTRKRVSMPEPADYQRRPN